MPARSMGMAVRAVVVMGVSASGKSAVGAALAAALDIDFVDGDVLHPQRNVDKMAGGHPLSDEDRAPWLDRVGAELADRALHPRGVVIACSALRRVYRARIRAAAGQDLVFVFLDIPREEAARRIGARKGHFMPASLLDSQYQTLERPDGEADVVAVSDAGGIETTAQVAAEALRQRMQAGAA